MVRFDYFIPENISAALSILEERSGKASVLAGGTDLLVQLKKKEVSPDCLIDLKKIDQLKGINIDNNRTLRIGVLTTINDIIQSEEVERNIPILREVAQYIGSVQIRNRATIGGNICRAAPSADFAPVLLSLDARLVIASPGGERTVDLSTFFIGPGQTILEHYDILKVIEIDLPPASWNVQYGRYSVRKTMDLSLVGVAVFLILNVRNGVCEDIRIALGSVAPTPFRARKTEALLRHEKLSSELITKASRIGAEETQPISDVYGSEWYKREIVAVQISRTISRANNAIASCKK